MVPAPPQAPVHRRTQLRCLRIPFRALGLPLTDLVPNDSYYVTFSNQLDDYFGGFGGTYYIGMGDTGLDYASLESQVAWEELTREVEDDESTFKDSELTTSWQRSLAPPINSHP